MAEKKEKQYVGDNAQLMAEWDWELNICDPPNRIGFMSNKKVWWKCSNGHRWESAISKRSQGQGCPYCSGRYPIIGETDLATTHPHLADEWNFRKNSGTPQSISAGSGKKVWWICKNGHEWEASIVNRSTKNRGCPYCSRHSAIEGETDLLTTHSELATEWHPTKNGLLTPRQVLPGSHKKVWWRCSLGHEWEAQVKSRTSGSGCPICANQQLLVGFNDLLSQDPEIAKEWHPTKNDLLLPNQITVGTDRKVWWRCNRGHEWFASVVSRHRTRCSCPVCNGETQTSFPEQAILFYVRTQTQAYNREKVFGKELDIYLPEMQVGIEYNGAYFHKHIQQDIGKIKYFSNKGIRIISVNEGTHNSILGDTIEYIYHPLKKDSLNWVIEQILLRLGLPLCNIDVASDASAIYSQYMIQEKENSFAQRYPDISQEWHPNKNGTLSPNQISFGSGKKVWWRCAKGHEWEAVVYSRAAGNNCPVCTGRKLLSGFNDLETLFPNIAAEWHLELNVDLHPSQVLAGSHKKVWWRCNEGHIWESSITNRTRKGHGCPICARKNRK